MARKQFLSLAFVCFMTLTLAACNGGNPGRSADTSVPSGGSFAAGGSASVSSGESAPASSGDTSEQEATPERTLVAGGEGNKADLGDMLQIIIEENRTTEYRWFLELSGDDILDVVSDQYDWDANPNGAAGAGGIRTITFLAVASGETTVELTLKTHEDGDASQLVTYQISVQ